MGKTRIIRWGYQLSDSCLYKWLLLLMIMFLRTQFPNNRIQYSKLFKHPKKVYWKLNWDFYWDLKCCFRTGGVKLCVWMMDNLKKSWLMRRQKVTISCRDTAKSKCVLRCCSQFQFCLFITQQLWHPASVIFKLSPAWIESQTPLSINLDKLTI